MRIMLLIFAIFVCFEQMERSAGWILAGTGVITYDPKSSTMLLHVLHCFKDEGCFDKEKKDLEQGFRRYQVSPEKFSYCRVPLARVPDETRCHGGYAYWVCVFYGSYKPTAEELDCLLNPDPADTSPTTLDIKIQAK